jgi:beta-N-acetylhexosaminidase
MNPPHPITRRALVGGLLAGVGASASRRAFASGDSGTLAADVGEMLMLGFIGDTVRSASATTLAEHIAAGRVGSVVFRKMNVGTREQVAALVKSLSPAGARPLLAIDHEGGFVQRLVGEGFTRLPPARQVAASSTAEAAKALYARAAAEVAAVGFNLNLAPVVDLHDSANPAIGHFDRAFDEDPARVTEYAAAFIDAFEAAGVHCALKHFPGEGHAHDDSHVDLPDITATWTVEDLEPYVSLIASGHARIVMGGHVRLGTLDRTLIPLTLSPAGAKGLLREQMGFTGVIMTDDLDMAAIHETYGRREAVIRAIAAGNDLLMVCNTDDFDPELPQHVVAWVEDAIAEGTLSATGIAASAARVRELKRSLL